MEELRVSVRELVEFTLHGADIRLISGRMQDMLDGTLVIRRGRSCWATAGRRKFP